MTIGLDLEEERVVQKLLDHESFFDPRYIESKFDRIIRDLDVFSEKLSSLKALAKNDLKDNDTSFMYYLFNVINKHLYFWLEKPFIQMAIGKNYRGVQFLVDPPDVWRDYGREVKTNVSLIGYASKESPIKRGETYSKEEILEAIKNRELIICCYGEYCNYTFISEREYHELVKKGYKFSYECKNVYEIARTYPEIVSYIRNILTPEKLNEFLEQYREIYKNILKGSKIVAYQYINSKNTTPNVEAKAQEICRKLTYLSEE